MADVPTWAELMAATVRYRVQRDAYRHTLQVVRLYLLDTRGSEDAALLVEYIDKVSADITASVPYPKVREGR